MHVEHKMCYFYRTTRLTTLFDKMQQTGQWAAQLIVPLSYVNLYLGSSEDAGVISKVYFGSSRG